MDADEYQDKAVSTEIYTKAASEFVQHNEITAAQNWLKLAYCVGKLNGEAGEIAELVFKNFRGSGGVLSEEEKEQLVKELGDVQWYVANIAALISYGLSDIMRINVEKLQDRKQRGVIHGYGDER